VHDLGEARLKDIQHEHVYQVSVDGEPSRFPPLKADRPKSSGEALAERIQAHVERQIEEAFGEEPKRSAPAASAAMGMGALAVAVFAVAAIVLGVILLFKLGL
jgi:hypothetical protein